MSFLLLEIWIMSLMPRTLRSNPLTCADNANFLHFTIPLEDCPEPVFIPCDWPKWFKASNKYSFRVYFTLAFSPMAMFNFFLALAAPIRVSLLGGRSRRSTERNHHRIHRRSWLRGRWRQRKRCIGEFGCRWDFERLCLRGDFEVLSLQTSDRV